MRVLAALAVVTATACASIPRPMAWPSGRYGEALAQVTRSVAIYSGADSLLFAYGVDETEAFQEARTQKLAQVFAVPAGPLANLRGGDLTEPEAGHVFYLAVETMLRSLNDLERPTGEWGLYLETDGRTLQPLKVVRVLSRYDQVEALYPFVNKFFASYRVVFPYDIGPGPYKLFISGMRGKGAMTFPGEGKPEKPKPLPLAPSPF